MTAIATVNEFRLSSNFTEFAMVSTLREAKREAVAESYRYDDIVTVEHNGTTILMARGGQLFSVRRIASPGRKASDLESDRG